MDDLNAIINDVNKLANTCKELNGKTVLVGIVGGGVTSEVMQIAHIHEYGDGKMPERSFIRASFDADQGKIEQIVSSAVNDVLDGKKTTSTALNAVGAQATQLVQNYIDENRVKPQSNFAFKTQHTTLYETGTHIRDRIAYEVVSE